MWILKLSESRNIILPGDDIPDGLKSPPNQIMLFFPWDSNEAGLKSSRIHVTLFWR